MENFFDPEPVVLAHRGDSINYPENTMPAFESAAAMGVHVIETDVHLTSDEEIVIWHDDTLERLSGDSRRIGDMTWKEIRNVNAGFLFTRDGVSYPYRESPIPPVLLKDLLSRFPAMRFNVDLKDDNLLLAEKHAELLKELQCEQRVVTASFHKKVLKHFRKKLPGAPSSCTSVEVISLLIQYRTGILFLPVPGRPRVLQVPEFSGPVKVLSSGFIKALHKRGYKVQVWTVNEKKEFDRFFQMGVDGIFTDRPALLLDYLKNR